MRGIGLAVAALALAASPAAAQTVSAQPVYVFGVPVDFILFALALNGVAVLHHKTLQAALGGLAAIVLYKLIFTGFKTGAGAILGRRAAAPHKKRAELAAIHVTMGNT